MGDNLEEVEDWFIAIYNAMAYLEYKIQEPDIFNLLVENCDDSDHQSYDEASNLPSVPDHNEISSNSQSSAEIDHLNSSISSDFDDNSHIFHGITKSNES